MFAWTPLDMLGIDTKVVTHRLAIHPSAKPVAQRKRKVSKDKRVPLDMPGSRILLEGPGDIVIEQTLKFKFTTNYNQAKYAALIVDMNLTLEMGVTRLKAKSDPYSFLF